MPAFTEKALVEDYVVKKLQEKGWNFVKAEALNRESYEEPLLISNLTEAIKRANKGIELSEIDISRISSELRSKSTASEGVKQTLRFLKHGIPIKLEKTRELRYVNLIDYENLENNEFLVSRQVIFEGREKIRVDIILYVNGIPLVLIECESPVDSSWGAGYNQIKNYEKLVPELFKYVQFSIAAEIKAKYFASVLWEKDTLKHTWRSNSMDELDSAIEMLSKGTLLDLIKNFVFIREEKSRVTKVIARYMQYYAANKIFERVISNFQGKENKNSGLIWHWQGSGKTLTMIFAANKLYEHKLLANPTIFFILDRTELEEQIYQEINFLDLGIKPEKISRIEELKDFLLHDEGRGKRGIFVILIHKFRKDELEELQKYLDKALEKNKETILTRKNVIAFIDEGHRTQYGLLAAQMREILKNAFFFAFTGTPIAKEGRDTYLAFSYLDAGEKYLDKYFIADSIKDGYTLPIVVESRPDQLNLRKDLLEAFLAQKYEEIPAEIEKEVEEEVKPRLKAIKLVMENPQRVEEIARDIAEHFKENVDGRFKGMVVAVSREACVLYKKALDNYLQPEYSEIVMTFTAEDDPVISAHAEQMKAKYKKTDIEDIKKEIIEKFKEEKYPKILIVTDMLLTGFDAPILQVMYLDKPLKEHRLLQAIARTNRPLKEKAGGVIVDYVGVIRELDKALKIYSEDDVKHVIYGEIEEEFKEKIEELKEILKGTQITYEREGLKSVVARLIGDGKEKEFSEKYRELRRKFELLGPRKIRLEFFEYYKWFTAIYNVYLKSRGMDEVEEYFKSFFKHTINSVYKSTEVEKIVKEFPEITVEGIKESKNIEARVFDRLSRIRITLKNKPKTPAYESIADRVEKIIKKWRERREKIEEIYKELGRVSEHIFEMERIQKELNLTPVQYEILSILENELGKKDGLIASVKNFYSEIEPEMFAGWNFKPSAIKRAGKIIRRFLIRLNLPKNKRDELHEKIFKILSEYGQEK